ncbi:hypothetical protein CBOM_07815 [Ceraceosorus bombacis]|uniref:Uncharacterized protein n=1 Tax=Ceraceosorus bombacis TaxID=401625 RepID=A0A0P1BIE4_9BASI|nr:hypothetical protein CBOM_07815 [Ceraceosorus bombacis]
MAALQDQSSASFASAFGRFCAIATSESACQAVYSITFLQSHFLRRVPSAERTANRIRRDRVSREGQGRPTDMHPRENTCTHEASRHIERRGSKGRKTLNGLQCVCTGRKQSKVRLGTQGLCARNQAASERAAFDADSEQQAAESRDEQGQSRGMYNVSRLSAQHSLAEVSKCAVCTVDV